MAASGQAAQTWPRRRRRLLVVGDSLSAGYGLARGSGWVALLRRRLAAGWPGWRVVNASVSGGTAWHGAMRLPALLYYYRPAVTLLALGANDGLNELAPAEVRATLAEMVERAQQAGSRVLLVGIRLLPRSDRAYASQFEPVFAEVARDYGVELVSSLLDSVARQAGMYQADRLHPSELAQPAMLAIVWQRLQPMIKQADLAPPVAAACPAGLDAC